MTDIPLPPGLAIRPYRAGDERAINDAFNEVFAKRRSLDEWRWKFRPETGGSRILLAADGKGRVAAQFAAVRTCAQVDGVEHILGQAVDLFGRRDRAVVHAAVFTRLGRAFFARYGSPGDLAGLFGIPGPRSQRIGRIRLGYPEGRPIPIWRRAVPRGMSWRPVRRVTTACDDAALDDLWRRAAPRYRTSTVRDAAWIRWRLLDRPGAPYALRIVWRDGTPAAWGAFSVSGSDAHWVDCVWDGRDARDVAALADAVGRGAKQRGARDIALWLSGDGEAEAVLANRGWSATSHADAVLVAMSFLPGLSNEALRDALYFTMADFDLH